MEIYEKINEIYEKLIKKLNKKSKKELIFHKNIGFYLIIEYVFEKWKRRRGVNRIKHCYGNKRAVLFLFFFKENILNFTGQKNSKFGQSDAKGIPPSEVNYFYTSVKSLKIHL